MLGVSKMLIDKFGSVSKEVTCDMAECALLGNG
jgi:nicotinamide mononucleotide (NMN) deamidase PncC